MGELARPLPLASAVGGRSEPAEVAIRSSSSESAAISYVWWDDILSDGMIRRLLGWRLAELGQLELERLG